MGSGAIEGQFQGSVMSAKKYKFRYPKATHAKDQALAKFFRQGLRPDLWTIQEVGKWWVFVRRAEADSKNGVPA